MLRRHTNALLREVLSAGFDPALFRGEEDDNNSGHPGFSVHLKNSPLYFRARNPEGNFDQFDYQFTEFAAGFPWTDIRPEPGYISFDELLRIYKEWLITDVDQYLTDVAVPDLWSQISAAHLMLAPQNSIPFAENFSTEEKEGIRVAMKQFKLRLFKEFEPTPAEREVVEQQLDHLLSAVDRLGKFDWQGVALNTIIGVGVTLSLDTERGRQLFGLFQQSFSYVLHLLK